MKSTYLAAAIAVAAFAQPAFAQDAAAPVQGPRVEVRAGFDRVQVKASYDDGSTAVSGHDHKDGVAFGGEFGYDRLVGPNVTLGAYAGVDFSTTKECSAVFGNDRACLKAGRNLTAGVRVATAVSPTISLYAKGGFSNGQVRLTYKDLADSTNNFKVSDNRDGFHVGAGAEVRFAHNVYGKVEYVYTDYSDYSVDNSAVTASADAKRHQVLTGIGVRF